MAHGIKNSCHMFLLWSRICTMKKRTLSSNHYALNFTFLLGLILCCQTAYGFFMDEVFAYLQSKRPIGSDASFNRAAFISPACATIAGTLISAGTHHMLNSFLPRTSLNPNQIKALFDVTGISLAHYYGWFAYQDSPQEIGLKVATGALFYMLTKWAIHQVTT